MAQAAGTKPISRGSRTATTEDDATTAQALSQTTGSVDREKVLPLPNWLKKVYFIFPVVLYIPDIIFNYYVYSDGFTNGNGTQNNLLLLIGGNVLIAFLSVGVVGMAYLLSVLAPWHWGQGHRIQAFFCGLGVVIATAITTWNSLAYRSDHFTRFKTDDWVYAAWPQLRGTGFSVSMILVSIAPPFWGLFWAIVQPTETGRNIRQLQESHAERLLRMQQEAEVKRLKAETTAKIREAQLRGMAATASAAREQASGFFSQMRKKDDQDDADAEGGAQIGEEVTGETLSELAPLASVSSGAGEQRSSNLVQLPTHGQGRTGTVMYNHAASSAVADGAHMEPANGARMGTAQPALISADVRSSGPSDSDTYQRPMRPPVMQGVGAFFPPDSLEADGMTGTTGPHTAARRWVQLGTLTRSMTEQTLRPEHVQAIQDVFEEYKSRGKKPSANELTAALAEKLHVSEAVARQTIARWRDEVRGKRR